MEWIGLSISSVVILIFVLYWLKIRKPKAERDLQKIIDSLTVRTTIGNHIIHSQKELTEGFKKSVQAAETIRQYIALSETWPLGPSTFNVLVFPSVRDIDANGNYSPSFRVPITKKDPYYSTEYRKTDKDGDYILAAERVLDRQQGVFIVADYKRNFAQAALAMVWGHEHIGLFHNDQAKYLWTEFHGTSGHPISGLDINMLTVMAEKITGLD